MIYYFCIEGKKTAFINISLINLYHELFNAAEKGMRGDWLSKNDKKDGGIIGQNFKKRDRRMFMKKRGYESRNKDSKNLHLEIL